MNRTQLKALAAAKAERIEHVNTNNAWGFGGAIKDIYHLPGGVEIHIGTVYFRHAPEERFVRMYKKHGVYGEGSQKAIENFLQAL
jgi:hypothetical protein